MPNVVFENHDYFSDNRIINIRKTVSTAGTVYVSNWHEHIEILLCKGGNGSILLDDRKYVFGKGNIIIVNSQVIHSLKSTTKMEYICAHINREFCAKNVADTSSNTFFELIQADKTIEKTLDEMVAVDLENGEFKAAKHKALTLSLLVRLFENYKADGFLYSTSPKAIERVKNAMIYIENNLKSALTLDDIAQSVGINKYQLTREFKATTGKPLFEYIKSLRCKAAMAMLKKGTSVTETAENCGFSNLSYFSRTYKKYMGELPGKTKKS